MSQTYWKLAGISLVLALAACSKSPPAQPTDVASPTAWRPFADDSPWNTPIPEDARTDPDSKALISDFAARGGLYINIAEWSVPVYYIDLDETPKHNVIDLYEGRSGRGFEQPRAIPIPDGATPAQPKGGTGYMALIDKRRNLEWDLKQAFLREDGKWFIGFGAVTNLRGSGVAKPWSMAEEPIYAASALPSGMPLSAGLIRVEDIESGRINHALAFAYGGVRPAAFIPPASTALAPHGAGQAGGMPLGARIQLDPEFDVAGSALSPEGKIIARALQEYGAYLADEAGGNVLFAESAPEQLKAWEGTLSPDEIQAVFSPEMMAKHFRLIEMGEVLPGQPVE